MILGVQPLQDIDEVNMFKDDNTVIHFKRPLSKFILLYISYAAFACVHEMTDF